MLIALFVGVTTLFDRTVVDPSFVWGGVIHTPQWCVATRPPGGKVSGFRGCGQAPRRHTASGEAPTALGHCGVMNRRGVLVGILLDRGEEPAGMARTACCSPDPL
jgi:hypothetical protein